MGGQDVEEVERKVENNNYENPDKRLTGVEVSRGRVFSGTSCKHNSGATRTF